MSDGLGRREGGASRRGRRHATGHRMKPLLVLELRTMGYVVHGNKLRALLSMWWFGDRNWDPQAHTQRDIVKAAGTSDRQVPHC